MPRAMRLLHLKPSSAEEKDGSIDITFKFDTSRTGRKVTGCI